MNSTYCWGWGTGRRHLGLTPTLSDQLPARLCPRAQNCRTDCCLCDKLFAKETVCELPVNSKSVFAPIFKRRCVVDAIPRARRSSALVSAGRAHPRPAGQVCHARVGRLRCPLRPVVRRMPDRLVANPHDVRWRVRLFRRRLHAHPRTGARSPQVRRG